MSHVCPKDFCPIHHDCDEACVCCCGDTMTTHSDPFSAGHAPVCAEAYYELAQHARKRDALQALLKRVTIREPFRSLLNVSLRLGRLDEHGGDVLISIDTYNADTSEPMKGWTNPFPFTAHASERWLRDPYKLNAFIIESLCTFLRHEAQESLLFDGVLAIPPLHNNAGAVEAQPSYVNAARALCDQ